MPQINHLAIIMDGNRRWATEQGKLKFFGHTEGAKNIKRVSELAIKQGIKYLTLYTLSTENLKNRSEEELKHLFSLMTKLANYIEHLLKNGVKLNVIGDISKLPEKVEQSLNSVMEKTKDNKTLTLSLAINYGSQNEITRAIKKIVGKNLLAEEIDQKIIENHLDTAGFPPVDLVVRTGGKQRLSNFLLWQVAYAEFYFTDTYWPAFGEEEFEKAITFFEDTQRNFGK